ncbi:EAL domain-containing protein [Cryobacterium sp. TMB3-1-2]|nr:MULTISPECIES: EAL domain-containing protein [unclassified Cryobacterium]TFC58960.1 EAL domain-containing protein [Cryobacterium sp. TMB1-7]TFC53710.1 EAL domain-containing protein [Cryobacterium sp. TMB3-1-2]TFC75129.1 EAL domain-containing protein [Cryobacterium sp. TMB3-15]TFC75265.1 EAL domain-containing protein [Cryobacterium sp. TMB3-10]TFD41542.1 EAL domain-containing protein [Cryobacterium sp. TMB3-12]
MLDAVSAGTGVTAAFQPIVDTARGIVVGFEGLARFEMPAGISVEDLFAQARAANRSAEIEARCLRVILAERGSVPTNCFITVNVSPHVLGHDAIRQVWRDQADLTGVFVELTEQSAIDSAADLEPELDAIRAAGGLIAVDDLGSGYAGLSRLLALKPALIKLDRELIQGIDTDEAKRALVEMIGTFANRIDSWVLAEGIETAAEYDTITALGVPLAQGYYLARPGPAWPDLARPVVPSAERQPVPVVRDLLDIAPGAESVAAAARIFTDHAEVRTVVLIDHHGRPVSVLDSESAHLGVTTGAVRVNLDTPVRDALLRAITRDSTHRYDPLIVTDNAGRYAGIVRLERLITTAVR